MNLDGMVCEVDGRVATGVVAREHTTFLGASTKVYDGVLDPLIAEALASRDTCA
jgi:hypothetical protein